MNTFLPRFTGYVRRTTGPELRSEELQCHRKSDFINLKTYKITMLEGIGSKVTVGESIVNGDPVRKSSRH